MLSCVEKNIIVVRKGMALNVHILIINMYNLQFIHKDGMTCLGSLGKQRRMKIKANQDFSYKSETRLRLRREVIKKGHYSDGYGCQSLK